MRPTLPLPDFGIPDLPELPLQRAMREKRAEIASEAMRLVTHAIDTWAKQAGMSTHDWLQVFDYQVSMKPGPAADGITITVSAKMRELPETFTVTV